MTTTTIDIGPAPAPPAWCEPDATPEWGSTRDGGVACYWTRDLSEQVWIDGADRIVDGRVVRSAPRIYYDNMPLDGLDQPASLELARALMRAGDLIASAAFGEQAADV